MFLGLAAALPVEEFFVHCVDYFRYGVVMDQDMPLVFSQGVEEGAVNVDDVCPGVGAAMRVGGEVQVLLEEVEVAPHRLPDAPVDFLAGEGDSGVHSDQEVDLATRATHIHAPGEVECVGPAEAIAVHDHLAGRVLCRGDDVIESVINASVCLKGCGEQVDVPGCDLGTAPCHALTKSTPLRAILSIAV